MDQKTIGRCLREMRKQRKLTQADMAKRLGLSQGRISQIENEGPAQTQTMIDWATACGTTLRLTWKQRGRQGEKVDSRVRGLLYR